MKAKRVQLKIELRSDLCSGSGLSYAGIIDQDIIYDQAGFPYIPARRIKGCMREAAEAVVSREMVDKLFGSRGASAPGCLKIQNAVLKEAQPLKAELEWAKQEEALSTFVGADDILELYTSVRAQTKIDQETGSAEENTLRFTRVVNRFNPLGADYLCFYAELLYEAENSQQENEIRTALERIAKAVRHIGMNRNRGQGNVRCSLVAETAEKEEKKNTLIRTEKYGDGKVKLSYMIENHAPLILSEGDKSSTISHISGKSILGALAGTYLREKMAEGVENPADTEEFTELFLDGTVKYTNLYPALAGRRTAPAPMYLNRLKKTKKLVNLLDGANDQEETKRKDAAYDPSFGNQPKQLKTQYTVMENKGNFVVFGMAEPDREIAFHHRHQHGEDQPDALLYSMEMLTEGQRFIGEIYADAKYEEQLKVLLSETDLRFGKSRAAQYGSCSLVPIEDQMEADWKNKSYSAGTCIVVTLKSDAVFISGCGSYTTEFAKVKELIADELQLAYDKNETDHKSMLQVTEVLGYHTLWNMKRAAVPAVKAGSVFVYRLTADWISGKFFVGERSQEGFGEIAVHELTAMPYKAEEIEDSRIEQSQSYQPSEDMQLLLYRIIKSRLLGRLINEELQGKDRSALSASGVGRVTLMLKESLNAAEKKETNMQDAKADLKKRIGNIKSNTARREAEKILKNTKELFGRMISEDAEPALGYLAEEQRKILVDDIWGEYMLQKMALMKYRKKGE